jgi:hypothetical protein
MCAGERAPQNNELYIGAAWNYEHPAKELGTGEAVTQPNTDSEWTKDKGAGFARIDECLWVFPNS